MWARVGQTWNQTKVIFLNATSLGTFESTGSFPQGAEYAGNWNFGTTDDVVLPVSGPVAVGTAIAGQVWASYQIGGTTYYAETGTLTATAT